MKLRWNSLWVLFGCSLLAVLNQNCGQQSSFSIEDLAANHSPSMLDVDLPESQARLGDRVFTASVFADIFLPQGREVSVAQAKTMSGLGHANIADYVSSNFDRSLDRPIVKVIDDFILKKLTEFHGTCSVVDGDDACSGRDTTMRRAASETSTIAPVSVTRDGYRISVCNKVLDMDRAVENLVSNITGSSDTVMSKKHIYDVYDAFYPERDISQEAYDALVLVFNSTGQEAVLDRWRAVAIPICHSSGWQVQ